MATEKTAAPLESSSRVEREELSQVEQQHLTRLEEVIGRGIQTFLEVGDALVEIREKRLYRSSHGTFEHYVRDRWHFTARRARQLMEAAEIGTIVPVENEAQARELVPLKGEPEAMSEVMREATREGGGKPVARNIRAAVRKRVASGRSADSPQAASHESPEKARARREAEERRAKEAMEVAARVDSAVDMVRAIDPAQLGSDLAKLPQEYFARTLVIEWIDRVRTSLQA